MKTSLSVLTWISCSTFLVSLAVLPLNRSPAQAQTHHFSSPHVTAAVTGSTLEADDAAIDRFIEQLIAEKQIPGLSIAVIHDQKLIKTKGYGMLDRELNVKSRPSSIFPIASMSKPLTATAIMLLVEAGKVELDAPINTYLPNTPEHWAPITVRHLLTHTSGLSEAVYNRPSHKIVTPEGFIEEASDLPLEFQPGETWMYSNTGYNLAATIVEEVSQQPFETFMETQVFEPLGMGNTDVLRASYRFSNRAMGYVPSENGTGVAPIDVNFNFLHTFMPMFRGSGSITSTVLDLARWAIAIDKGSLLSSTSHSEMQQMATLNSGLVAGYGLGWSIQDVQGHNILAHGGNLWGYSTAIARFPDDQLTVIMLTNKDNEFGEDLAKKVAEQYVPALAIDRKAAEITDSNPELTAGVLAYVNGEQAAITFTPERQLAFTTGRGQFIQRFYQRYAQEHTTQSLALIAQEAHPNGTRKIYRATTNSGINLITVIVTPEGLVNTVSLSPDHD